MKAVLVTDAICVKAYFELGMVYKALGQIDDAHVSFEKAFGLVRGEGGASVSSDSGIDWYATPIEVQTMFPPYKSSKTKMQHDAQQLAYLMQQGKVGRGTNSFEYHNNVLSTEN